MSLRTQPSSGEPPRGGKRPATAVVIQTENPSCGPHVLIDRRGYKTRGVFRGLERVANVQHRGRRARGL